MLQLETAGAAARRQMQRYINISEKQASRRNMLRNAQVLYSLSGIACSLVAVHRILKFAGYGSPEGKRPVIPA